MAATMHATQSRLAVASAVPARMIWRPRAALRLSAAAQSSNVVLVPQKQPAKLQLSRRILLGAASLVPVLSTINPADAAVATEFKTFLGYSQAPDLYLGYGQAQDAAPLYKFEYPADWVTATPTKTEKSTMGMDGMVVNPRSKKELAYVVALGGKDYRDSVLTDAKSSLIVFAGSDPDLRNALSDGIVQQEQKDVNGAKMYVYRIFHNRRSYLSTISKKGDTVFALVVSAPSNTFESEYDKLQHIQDTFQLLDA